MARLWKSIAKGLTPPVMWRAASLVKHTVMARLESLRPAGEKSSAWYDRIYRDNEEYHKHYTMSCYYFLWTVVADRLVRAGSRSVLDIGCGPGQFASLLRDRGVPRYFGIDLSGGAVHMAQAACPEYGFLAGSIFETDILETLDYDTVIALEFLEHVEDDLGVLQRIPKGRRFIGSVPNFPASSHVRIFQNGEEVVGRYGSLFEQFSVDVFLANNNGFNYYLLEGVRP